MVIIIIDPDRSKIITGKFFEENLKIRLIKIGALKNLTNLQAHLKAQFIDCLKMNWQLF